VQSALNTGGDYAFGADCTLDLTSPLTMTAGTASLDGAGHSVVLDGGGTTQLVVVSGSNLTLSGLVFQHGNNGTTAGGAIEFGFVSPSGTLTVTNSSFLNNTASFGGAIGAGGPLVVANSTFIGNTGGNTGGAIYAQSAVAVTGSTFISNTAVNGGGAILLAVFTGQGSVANSTFTGNRVTSSGGSGGALLIEEGTAAVVNSTFADNTAPSGGALATEVSGLPPTINVGNTLLINNTCSAGFGGVISDGGNNLEFASSGPNTTCGFTLGVQHGDPLLGALADNGGPTETMAIGTTGAAYNTGNPAVCAAAPVSGVDQRGAPRTTSCSIGAYEPAPPAPTATETVTAAPTATATALPYPTCACAGLNPTRKLGDINGDGVVNLSDFTIFAEDYGKDTSQGAVLTSSYSDMNCDGKVDLTDFSIFAGQYGG
jgi:predicted outer membrane repeat protein